MPYKPGLFTGVYPFIDFKTGLANAPYLEGRLFYDDTNKTLAFYDDESETTLQIGQENWLRGKNNTGSDIENGEVVYISGVDGAVETFSLAKADSSLTSLSTIGIATHKIEAGTIGKATRIGTLHDFDTAGPGFTAGDQLWLSPITAGLIINVQPTSPNFSVFLGNAGVIDANDGTIEVHISAGGNTRDVIKIFNGATLQSTSVVTTSDGADITLSFEQAGGGNVDLFFDGQFTPFTAAPATVILTPGTNDVPVENFVFIPESTNTLTANTTGFPAPQHAPVASVICPTAALAATDGVYKEHAWTDHLSDTNDQGHLAHMNKWIRNQWATLLEPETSIDLTIAGSGTGTVTVETTSGQILQLHQHTMPAVAAGSNMFAFNDVTPSYTVINGLEDMLLDSGGAALTNKYYNLVMWIVASQNAANSHIFFNVPDGSYSTQGGAESDASNFSDFKIPIIYKGTAAICYRLLMRNQTDSTFTLIDTFDLRGLLPGNIKAGN